MLAEKLLGVLPHRRPDLLVLLRAFLSLKQKAAPAGDEGDASVDHYFTRGCVRTREREREREREGDVYLSEHFASNPQIPALFPGIVIVPFFPTIPFPPSFSFLEMSPLFQAKKCPRFFRQRNVPASWVDPLFYSP